MEGDESTSSRPGAAQSMPPSSASDEGLAGESKSLKISKQGVASALLRRPAAVWGGGDGVDARDQGCTGRGQLFTAINLLPALQAATCTHSKNSKLLRPHLRT